MISSIIPPSTVDRNTQKPSVKTGRSAQTQKLQGRFHHESVSTLEGSVIEASIPSSPEPERQQLKLSQLQDYPLQSQTYSPSSVDEDERLKNVLCTGVYDPLHVMPPNNKAGLPEYTKLDGHRRARLLAELGQEEAEVIVRYDLVNADRTYVDMAFYDFALGRRNSHPLDLARMVLRRYELEKGRSRGKLRQQDEMEARDRVGKAIGMSGRNLHRYFRLLLTPDEVQRAVRDGQLSLVMGEKVEGVTKLQQAEIAQRIRGGENAKKVIGEYIAKASDRHRKAEDAFIALTKDLERALADLEDRPNKIYCQTLKEHTPLLERSQKLITKLIAAGKKEPGNIANLLKKVNAQDEQEDFDDAA